MTWSPHIVTLPKDTLLCHERSTLFPECKLYPYFTYNWYSTKPFWSNADTIWSKPKNEEPIARYIYSVKEDVPNFIEWRIEEETALAHLFQQMWPYYILEEEDEVNDYALAAFAIQVLGYSGLLSYDEKGNVNSVIMGGTDRLKFAKLLTFNHPQLYLGSYTTGFPHREHSDMSIRGITHYTPEDIAKIRAYIETHSEVKPKP